VGTLVEVKVMQLRHELQLRRCAVATGIAIEMPQLKTRNEEVEKTQLIHKLQ
jgi:hypothetical protein